MNRYLLDTNAVGDFINHRYGLPQRVGEARRRGAIIDRRRRFSSEYQPASIKSLLVMQNAFE